LAKKKEKRVNETNNSKNIKEKKKKKGFIGCFIIIILLSIVAYGTFSVLQKINDNGGGLQGVLGVAFGHNKETKNQLERVNFLLLGESENMTDTIIVCSYYPKIDSISMLSIPRDTFVGYSYNYATPSDKINSLYIANDKDPAEVLEAVEEITGLDIPYYIVVDTEAVQEIVNAIGGVWFDVPIDMEYDDPTQDLCIRLTAGYQLIDGAKAEQLVRFRHNNDGTTYSYEYGEEDLGRMKTQKNFIKEAIKQSIKAENILKASEFIKIAEKYVKTNMDFSNYKDYIPYLTDVDLDSIKSAALPGVPQALNGYWFYLHDEDETQLLIDEMFRDIVVETEDETDTNTMIEETTAVNIDIDRSNIKIEVLNGSNDKNALDNVVSKLEKLGYQVVRTGNTVDTEETEIINRTNQNEYIIGEIEGRLGWAVISNGVERSNIDITIIIGEDY